MSMHAIGKSTFKAATSTAFSAEEKNMLGKIKDPAQRAQMEAQLQLQKHQQMAQFISNILRSKGDTEKAIIQNIR